MLLHTHTKLSTAPESKNQTLHVVSMVSNPVGYKSRHRLYEEFMAHMSQWKNVHLTTAELTFGERSPGLIHHGHRSLQYQTWDELWHKENILNLAIASLPSDWQYVAVLDADIAFTNPHWVNQTLNALQHHMVVQVFSDAVDLGPNGEIFQTHKSLGGLFASGATMKVIGDPYSYGTYAHPGFAWAYRREAIDHMGGLIDFALAGSGDHHMALSLIGQAKSSLPGGVSKGYADRVYAFQAQCEKYIRRDLGVVPGTITHFFHGPKNARGYETRWKILVQNRYDPGQDIKKDWQGVLQLVDHGNPRSIKLRDDLRRYFRARNEDDIRST